MNRERIIKLALVVFVGMTINTRLKAEDISAVAPQAIKLTLPKAEELALTGNPQIHASDERALASQKQYLTSLLPNDPMLMFDRSGQQNSPLDFSTGMDMWMVEEKFGFPGRSFAEAGMASAEAGKMQAMAADTRRSILLQTRQAFWEFYFRSKVTGVLQKAHDNLQSLSQLVQSKDLSGQWLSIKAIRMQMELAKVVNDLITNGRALKISQFNLNHLFSLSQRSTYELGEEPALPVFEGKEEAMIREALQENAEIKAYQNGVEVQRSRLLMANWDYLPDFLLRLSGTKDPGGGGFSEFGFRFGFSVPLFFMGKQSQMVEKAAKEFSAAQFDLKGIEDEVAHRVEDAYVNAESAWRVLKLYEEGELLKQTQKAWDSTLVAYRNEEMSLTDLVETYNTYLETLTNYYQARSDYGKALAELDYEIGKEKGDNHVHP